MIKCHDNLSHYSVLAPEIVTYEYFEGYLGAPEYWHPWVSVLAQNAKQAMSLAMKTDEFKEWLQEARSDGINPFKGVKATLFRCEHNFCWGCLEEDSDDLECVLCMPAE
jgi:hypothetical protein